MKPDQTKTKDDEKQKGIGRLGAAPWFGVGDLVSVDRCDKIERPPNRVGTPAKVTQLETGEYSETGIMVTVIGASGKTLRVDMNWLHPYTPNDKLTDCGPEAPRRNTETTL